MIRIGIIGASGQVGSSVAFFLQSEWKAEVTCFIRSNYSRIFFDLLQIPVEHIDLSNKEELREKLSKCDMILLMFNPISFLISNICP